MATETLLDLLEKERNMLYRKREVEFDIMRLQHRHEEVTCFPEYGRDDPENLKNHINARYEELNNISQELPEIQVKIKDAMEVYKNAEFVSGEVFRQ